MLSKIGSRTRVSKVPNGNRGIRVNVDLHSIGTFEKIMNLTMTLHDKVSGIGYDIGLTILRRNHARLRNLIIYFFSLGTCRAPLVLHILYFSFLFSPFCFLFDYGNKSHQVIHVTHHLM